ncbi:hypothetical protein ACEQ8H_006735 [Pleosporales sp. CAS-2024a]
MAATAIPPPYFITADDKRGLIVVTVALVLAFVWLCSLIRVWLRWKARHWTVDDWLLAAATLLIAPKVVDTAQSAVILHLVNLGLGAAQDGLPKSQLEQIGKEGIASQIFYVSTLLLSKWSVLFLYLCLSPGGVHKIISIAMVVITFLWAVLAIILIVVPCNPAQFYTDSQKCTNRWPKWVAISSLDIVTEACIFGIAIQLVWGLNMRIKSKLIVVFAFSARLPVIALSGLRMYYLHNQLHSAGITFIYLVVTQWQMGYAIMSSTITGMGPFLRPFTKEYATSYAKSKYGYGFTSTREMDPYHDAKSCASARRTSSQSEGYLMHSIALRRPSRGTTSDTQTTSVNEASASTISSLPTVQLPNLLVADANFRPVDHVSRTNTEIWVGERSPSIATAEEKPAGRGEEKGLVISRRTQVKVEVDRASRVI